MAQRHLKPVQFSKFYNSVSKIHTPLILDETEVVAIVESMQSFFTKTDTVYESKEVSVVRIVDPLIRFDVGYPKPNFLAAELFVATLTRGERNKYIAIYSPVRLEIDGTLPDRELRQSLIKFMKQVWNVTLQGGHQ